MKKGWKQRWKNVLFQHFEIKDITTLKKYLPKGSSFDSFDAKYYLGLVSMNMSDVRHQSTGEFIWFKEYNELNVRTYIVHDGKPGVLFMSLDVNSLISLFGARVLYGLPYRLSSYKNEKNRVTSFRNSKLQFQTHYSLTSQAKFYEKDTFAYWATERYFFLNRHLGATFKGVISHKQWKLSSAVATNSNLDVLKEYTVHEKHSETFFCEELNVETSSLSRIK